GYPKRITTAYLALGSERRGRLVRHVRVHGAILVREEIEQMSFVLVGIVLLHRIVDRHQDRAEDRQQGNATSQHLEASARWRGGHEGGQKAERQQHHGGFRFVDGRWQQQREEQREELHLADVLAQEVAQQNQNEAEEENRQDAGVVGGAAHLVP